MAGKCCPYPEENWMKSTNSCVRLQIRAIVRICSRTNVLGVIWGYLRGLCIRKRSITKTEFPASEVGAMQHLGYNMNEHAHESKSLVCSYNN